MALTRKKPQPATPAGSSPEPAPPKHSAPATAKRRGLGGLLHGIGKLPGPLRKLSDHKQRKLDERRKADEAEASRRRQAVLRNRRPSSVPMLSAAVISRTTDDRDGQIDRPASKPGVTVLDKPLPKPAPSPVAPATGVKPATVGAPPAEAATKPSAPAGTPVPAQRMISDVMPVRPMSRGAVAGHVRRPAQPAVRRVQL